MKIVIKHVVTCAFGVAMATSVANAATVVRHAPASTSPQTSMEKVAYSAHQDANTLYLHKW